LQDYPDVESWAFLDKLICHWRIAEDKVRAQCGLPPATPYGRCELFRGQVPTEEWLAEEAGLIHTVEVRENPLFNATAIPVFESSLPVSVPAFAPSTFAAPVAPPTPPPVTASPITAPPVAAVTPAPVEPIPVVFITPSPVATAPIAEPTSSGEVPLIQCDAWKDTNFDRMCDSDAPCCGSTRSDTNYCLGIYEQFGFALEAACYHCCATPQPVAPAAPVLADLPQTIQCSSLANVPHRMCKTDSCCSNPRANSDYCVSQYGAFNDNELAQICHYCCSTPDIIGPSIGGRNLRSGKSTDMKILEESRKLEGAKEFNVLGKKFLLSKDNFLPIEEDEQTYFDKQYAEHKRRNLQGVHQLNYDDIEWAPYEWLFRVETEYYFRYEGTMMVPPCWEVVHWRNLKDPIRVHKRQIDELNRLLAWRNNPTTCVGETAGIVTPDGSRILGHRELQYMHEQHRFVFCECKDWPSKFKKDREWCHRFNEDLDYSRFYTRPYSFDANANWLPVP
jgi:Eukaryotic-type carbonic anhydrase